MSALSILFIIIFTIFIILGFKSEPVVVGTTSLTYNLADDLLSDVGYYSMLNEQEEEERKENIKELMKWVKLPLPNCRN